MAKDKITEYDATAANNTVVGDVNLAENSALPSDMNNAVREVMSHLKGFASGTDAIDALTVTGAATVNGAFTSRGIDDNADATAITIDSSENVGIGTSSPDGSSFSSSSSPVVDISGTRPLLVLSETDSNTKKAWVGLSSDAFYLGGTNTDTRFYTNNSERLRILSGGGITFNGDTAAANALDDYEEGTWTPSIGGSATYNSGNDGRYVKVGGIVHCTFLANINSRGTGSQVRLSGLPFASQNTGFVHSGCVSYFANLNSNVTFVGFYVESNATTMQFVCATGSAGPTIAGNGFSVFKDSTVVYGAVSYPTDA